jgi:hypothetical protein
VAVAQAQRDRASQVQVKVVYSAAREVKASGPGLVTAVNVQVGQELKAGAPVVSFNDRVRLAFMAPAPMWRDIGMGTRGDDVARVQDFLTVLGYEAGSTKGTVTQSTLTGIRALNQSLGYGASDTTVHRESMVWIGAVPFTVAEVVVHAGDTLAEGAPLARGSGQPTAIEVKEPDIFTPLAKDHVLSVGEARVPYVTGSLRVQEPSAVDSIARALRGQSEGPGAIRLAAPESVGTLPVAAIVTDADGRMCVYESVTGPPVKIAPIGGSLSSADVPLDWVGRPVLANPRDVRAELSCG